MKMHHFLKENKIREKVSALRSKTGLSTQLLPDKQIISQFPWEHQVCPLSSPRVTLDLGHQDSLLLLQEYRLANPDGLIYPCNNFNLDTISKTRTESSVQTETDSVLQEFLNVWSRGHHGSLKWVYISAICSGLGFHCETLAKTVAISPLILTGQR